MGKITSALSPDQLNRVAEILKTIAHPVRLSVLETLAELGRLSVSELQEKTGIEQSLLSHHLIKMKDKGVLVSNREGKSIIYELADRHIISIFSCMEKCTLILYHNPRNLHN